MYDKCRGPYFPGQRLPIYQEIHMQAEESNVKYKCSMKIDTEIAMLIIHSFTDKKLNIRQWGCDWDRKSLNGNANMEGTTLHVKNMLEVSFQLFHVLSCTSILGEIARLV